MGSLELGNPERVRDAIHRFIILKVREARADGVVLGLSGGIDSSLVAALCAQALGQNRVLGLLMPHSANSAGDMKEAANFANSLGIRHETVGVAKLVSSMETSCSNHRSKERLPRGNLRSRCRMLLSYWHANQLNYLVAGTGNRSELLTGYFTKYGDGGCDFLPIGDLYKTQVLALASFIGLPKKLVHKVPTAGLWPGQTDEGELGITYAKLDLVLHYSFDKNLNPFKTAKLAGVSLKKVESILERCRKSRHKLEMPPICSFTP